MWTHFFKHIECCNFQIITEMYIKVYISGMGNELGESIFDIKFYLNWRFFEKMAKKTLFWSKIFVTSLTKIALS